MTETFDFAVGRGDAGFELSRARFEVPDPGEAFFGLFLQVLNRLIALAHLLACFFRPQAARDYVSEGEES